MIFIFFSSLWDDFYIAYQFRILREKYLFNYEKNKINWLRQVLSDHLYYFNICKMIDSMPTLTDPHVKLEDLSLTLSNSEVGEVSGSVRIHLPLTPHMVPLWDLVSLVFCQLLKDRTLPPTLDSVHWLHINQEDLLFFGSHSVNSCPKHHFLREATSRLVLSRYQIASSTFPYYQLSHFVITYSYYYLFNIWAPPTLGFNLKAG